MQAPYILGPMPKLLPFGKVIFYASILKLSRLSNHDNALVSDD
jgi:hypothetical protein